MNRVDQKALVIETLRRREHIAAETRARLAELERGGDDPLVNVDPEVRREAEEEYSASIGRRRYVTSDGRVLFLTPEEAAQRRRAKARNAAKGQLDEVSVHQRRRRFVMWAFNVGVIGLGVLLGWLLLR